MKYYIFLLSLFSILSASNDLEKYEADSSIYVKLKSKSSDCRVSYYRSTFNFDMTDCLNFKNSKGVSIFCTKDKSICKIHNEIAIFAISGKPFDKEKISKITPFNGRKIFNFAGGNGTGETIEISTNGLVTMELHGKISSMVTFSGTYEKFLKNYFIYGTDIICRRANRDAIQCVELDTLDVSSESISEEVISSEKVNEDKMISLCTKTINAEVFRKTNPFKLKGKCVEASFEIMNIISEYTAFGYILLSRVNLRTLSVEAKIGKRAVYVTAEGELSNFLLDGAKIQGLFKIVGTEKMELLDGSEVTANSLLWIKKIK